MFERCRQKPEVQLHVAAQQVGYGRRIPAIGDVENFAPVIMANNSPATWEGEPLPDEAMLSRPGIARA